MTTTLPPEQQSLADALERVHKALYHGLEDTFTKENKPFDPIQVSLGATMVGTAELYRSLEYSGMDMPVFVQDVQKLFGPILDTLESVQASELSAVAALLTLTNRIFTEIISRTPEQKTETTEVAGC